MVWVRAKVRGADVLLWAIVGVNVPLKTTNSTPEAHTKSLDVGPVPKKFQDAIDACRKVGVKYIWMDSLCIRQDSEADWESESAQVARRILPTRFQRRFLDLIYLAACLTNCTVK
jgi:hypothetical protein